jgi:hypothetical protein
VTGVDGFDFLLEVAVEAAVDEEALGGFPLPVVFLTGAVDDSFFVLMRGTSSSDESEVDLGLEVLEGLSLDFGLEEERGFDGSEEGLTACDRGLSSSDDSDSACERERGGERGDI